MPFEALDVGHSGGGAGWQLAGQRHRIGLVHHLLLGIHQLVLVDFTRLQARHEQLPHAGLVAQAHGMAAAVPAVEGADHRDAPGIGRPHGEAHACHAVDLHELCTQAAAEIAMSSLADQVQVDVTEQETEAVGVFRLLNAVGPVNAQPVGEGLVQRDDEQPRRAELAELPLDTLAVPPQDLHPLGAGQVDPERVPVSLGMHPQHRERVGMAAVCQGLGIAAGQGGVRLPVIRLRFPLHQFRHGPFRWGVVVFMASAPVRA